ncbi:hypothetical protein K4K49_002513 [Colletotrichum sp. SAR 10_70]|nr:hypothetical protein K4K50_002067 [Colletotrichum sp. SAR 10_71]KAI8199835.1 hypothetical protein K4K49_002513 [Colletotrichum sp. SAR 10_70]
MRLRPVSQNLSLVCLHSALAQVDLACGQIDTQANLVVQNSSIAQPRIASIVPSLLLDMPILISSDAWAKWQPVIEELHADYEFPVKTKTELNAILSLYTGEGISFCLNQDHWRFIIDVIRSRDDVIEDIVTISVIKRPQGNTNTANGWLITRTCDIHGALNADKVVENRDLAWFGILKNSLSHKQCCRVEVTGPYVAQAPSGNWKGIRLAVNQYSYVREIASLRQQLQEKKSETSSKRKLSVVTVTEDDIAESPAFKKLRKSKAKYKDAKTEAEDRATAAEDRGKELEQEIESLRGELLQKKMLVAQKDKAINDLRREYAIKDVSLQSLREQVAKQRKGPSTGGEDLGEHLESAMKINEDKAIGLATENSVLKGVVDRQKAEMNELTRKLTRGNRAMDTKSRDFKRLQELVLREVPQQKIPGNLRGLQADDSNNQLHTSVTMAPRVLSDVWERWASAVTYFMRQEFLPIRDQAHFQRYINNELKKGNSIRLDAVNRQFIIDLIETSPDKFDIVAFSIIKFSGHSLTGGEVVTELSAKHPTAADHVELIPGMETVGITQEGKIKPMCCREDWMKNSQKDDRHPRAIAETSRRKIVEVAKERKIQALKLPPSEPKRESSMTSTEDQGVNDELNRNLAALCKKAATLAASKGERKTIKVNENISTQEAISFISKAIDDLRHWAPSGSFDQAQHDNASKVTSSKSTVIAEQIHSQEKLQLESEVRRITEEKERLEKINADLKEDLELSRSRAKDAEEKLRQLTGQHSHGVNGEELAENSAHQVTGKLQEAFHQHKNRQDIIRKQVSEEGQDSPQSPSEDGTDDEELVIKDDSFDEDALSEELAKELGFMAKGEDVASKESGKQSRVSQLERELKTTKEALKNKTDELASATEQHARELMEARESKEKCGCKNKEAYVESLEEHVEKLRGTMEDVLRDVSTYQGRKRRRTKGPDFEY